MSLRTAPDVLTAAEHLRTRWYRMVPHERIPAYLALGWMVVADLGPVHGEWSVLMRWSCDCTMVEPAKAAA